MVPLTLAMMIATEAAALPAFILPPSKPARCAGACAARYRIPASDGGSYSPKDRALADDGSKCDVVGARRCAAKRHVVLRSGEDPMDTLREAIGDD